jgi:hypothetical protein
VSPGESSGSDMLTEGVGSRLGGFFDDAKDFGVGGISVGFLEGNFWVSYGEIGREIS